MSKYAANTTVSSASSREEIERTLQKYGADQFVYATDRTAAMVQFRMSGRIIRFVVEMPDPNDREFTHTPKRGTRRTEDAAQKEWEQATRQRWRALALVIKAKLEAVEAGISEFEREFLGNIVLPDNSTVSDFMLPQIERAYEHSEMPRALPQLEVSH